MRVVADAGPVIHLSMIGSFDLLTALYDRIMVPSLVFDEVTVRGAGLPGSAELSQADWVEVARHDSQAHLFRLLGTEIDPGEAAAICLAVANQADLLLSDDRKARAAAEALGLQVKGTLGILTETKRRGMIASLGPRLWDLQAKGVWLGDSLIERVLKEAGER